MTNTWCFENFGNQDIGGSVDDNSKVGVGVEVGNYPIPPLNKAHVFRDFNRAIQCNIFSKIAKNFLKRKRASEAVTIRVFGLNNYNFICVVNKSGCSVKHSL
ncbi:hypothetical protein D3C87_1459220 [compost metagenome]